MTTSGVQTCNEYASPRSNPAEHRQHRQEAPRWIPAGAIAGLLRRWESGRDAKPNSAPEGNTTRRCSALAQHKVTTSPSPEEGPDNNYFRAVLKRRVDRPPATKPWHFCKGQPRAPAARAPVKSGRNRGPKCSEDSTSRPQQRHPAGQNGTLPPPRSDPKATPPKTPHVNGCRVASNTTGAGRGVERHVFQK